MENTLVMAKSTEELLRNSEERFRTLVQNIKDYAIFMLDAEGIIIEWSEGAQHMKGYSAEEIIGQHYTLFFTPEAIINGEPANELSEAASTGRAERVGIRVRKNGEHFWVDEIATAVRDADGVLLAFTKISRDITESKNAQEALMNAEKQKDEYIAMLGHELRNPLAPIRNVLEILKMSHPGDREIAPAVDLMSRQIDHITRLVNDLLDMSRISRQKINLRPEITDLVAAVSRAVEMTWSTFQEIDRELIVDLAKSPIIILADITRIIQIVANLLNNAAKFTLPGGRVWLTVRQNDQVAIISIRDDGIGIAREYHDAIFQPFVQIDTAVDRSRGGLGLGLAMAKQLTEMHGGSIRVISQQKDRGSEFVVTLPIYQA